MPDNDILNSLKGMLGDNADEKISAVLGALKNSSDQKKEEINIENDISFDDSSSSVPVFSSSSPQQDYMMQIKNIVDHIGSANDQRSNLLMSLRPFMREPRQKTIDNAIKILNLSKFSGIFKL